MDDEENQDQLINWNTSHGKGGRQGPFIASDDEEDGESEESGSEEEEDLDEEGGEEEDGSGSEEEDDDDEEEGDLPLGSSDPNQPAAELNDDQSSDEERENCPICLNGFRDQVVGTPENCNHYFCLDCIAEWSKNANSCPVDRITFSCIHIRAHYGGEILNKVPVQNKGVEAVEEEEDATNCEVCGRSDREDRLLLCDGCDSGYHMECLTPALNAVPVDEWFCPECAATNQSEEDQVSEEEVAGLLADVVPTTSRLRTNVRTRAIARTRQSERVRENVNRIRTTAHTTQDVPRYLMSSFSLLDETIEAVVAGLNTAVYQRNLTPRMVTTKRKRRTGKKTSQSKVPKGGRGVGKRRRRRVKKRRGRRQIMRKVPTSHSRIAKSLGMCSPLRGSSIPRFQRAAEPTLGSMRHDIGAASLSLFGNPFDLDPFDSNEDHNSNPVSPLTAKRRVLSRSALRSHQPVARPISVGLSRGGVAPPVHGSVGVGEPVPDLLGSILSGQSMLMMKSSDILINRDGSLTAKKAGGATSQGTTSREDLRPDDVLEPSSSNSGSPKTPSSINSWKPIGQKPQPSFSSSGLYSLSPTPSPPSSSSSSPRGTDRLSLPSSLMPAFRLKNAFTPRVVQVQSSAGRLASKSGEPPRFNGTFHKPEPPTLSDPSPSKRLEVKHPSKPPAKRLDISEFPRIPKIKKETDISANNNASKPLVSPTSSSENVTLPVPGVSQLTGRVESKQLGRFNTGESTEKHTCQDSQANSRHTGGTSTSQMASGSGKAPSCSNISRNVGSSDSGVGGLRITISGCSSNPSRQFSQSEKDPFRSSEGKTQQKVTSPYSTNSKREKNVKNEIYDPFEPTGSDSASPGSSPERPVTPPLPSSSAETPITITSTPSTGVKVGAFRSFKFTTHSSKVGVSKLGPDFSGSSPNNKDQQESKSPIHTNPTLAPFINVEKELKKEVIEEIKNEPIPFRISCPLSGLKITSDLKPGGSRGFHFDMEDQSAMSVKSNPDIIPNRTFHHSPPATRVVWGAESHSEPLSLSISHSSEPQKKKSTVKEELKTRSRSRSKSTSRSQEQKSRSASGSAEERGRERKYIPKSHKVKRAHSDRSSSGSYERSKKKRQKEKKKEKKRKKSVSKERKRSRSSSHSSSSHRIYNSKKKKKKKRESRNESTGRSVSPEKEKKRKHKLEKSFSSKEGSFRGKEKKKTKDVGVKQRSKSPQLTKEYKAHKSKDRVPHFQDMEVTRHIVLSPNNNDNTITCTVSFKTDYSPITQGTRKFVLPKVEDERDEFLYLEREVSIKQERDSDSSDHDEEVQLETKSPTWSPSLMDSLLPEDESEDVHVLSSPKDSSPLNNLPSPSHIASPQASPFSADSEPPSPKSPSPQLCSRENVPEPVVVQPVKTEEDDLQWSPSHLDDFLLNELSDDVCSVDAASPDDVDLEEAILMKREEDYKEPTVINFSKEAVIPFLQDDENSCDAESQRCIDKKTTDINVPVEDCKSDLKESENSNIATSNSRPLLKRVTWNLHHKESDKDLPEQSVSSQSYSAEQEENKHAVNQVTSCEPDPASKTSNALPWNVPNISEQDSTLPSVNRVPWNAGNRPLTNVVNKPEEKPVAHEGNRTVRKASQTPWHAADTPVQVFPQTLPPLPLPPIFPPYAPVNESTVPCITQSGRTMLSQTPKPGSLAIANEPKMQAANTGDNKGKSKHKKEEKGKTEEYMKKLHIQERAVEEVKLAIKPFYQKREITKEEYKEILRKAVQKICHSKSGEINPVKVVNLVKGYVDKYKHIRNKLKKSGAFEDPDMGHESPI